MNRVLLLHAHPAPHKSHANRLLLETAAGVDGVQIRPLYEIYPDFLVDVAVEQRLLEEHEIVVLQHPMYWYSAPSLVKEWMDLVLQPGWAYGDGGNALRGKVLQHVVTCGGSDAVYRADGRHGHTVREFLLPFEQSALLCGMRYPEPFVVHGIGGLLGRDAMEPHQHRYRALLTGLRDGTLNTLPRP